jgi:hypothetical protein
MSKQNGTLDRRKVLLGGTTLAAAAIGASAPLTVTPAQAQQRPAPASASGRKPKRSFESVGSGN